MPKSTDLSLMMILLSGNLPSKMTFLRCEGPPTTLSTSSPWWMPCEFDLGLCITGCHSTAIFALEFFSMLPSMGETEKFLLLHSHENSAKWLLGLDRVKTSSIFSPKCSWFISNSRLSLLTLSETGTTSATTSNSKRWTLLIRYETCCLKLCAAVQCRVIGKAVVVLGGMIWFCLWLSDRFGMSWVSSVTWTWAFRSFVTTR
mmetsp:Transcript_8873/g.31982  ORF Transcript_8873/g.31982 Transcript_8873/m.31982 type:complete len:202 (+) Transcript_8873:6904-7509(+)